jgi:hypothetical protein
MLDLIIWVSLGWAALAVVITLLGGWLWSLYTAVALTLVATTGTLYRLWGWWGVWLSLALWGLFGLYLVWRHIKNDLPSQQEEIQWMIEDKDA